MVDFTAPEELLQRITTSRAICEGRPVVRHRSLTVEQVLSELAAGKSYEALVEQHPWMETEDIHACLLYAQQVVAQFQPEPTIDDLFLAVPSIVEKAPYLKLLVLFGSRGRGNAHKGSDWDFAFLCDEQQRKQYEQGGFSWLRLWGVIQEAYKLKDDEIDAIDLKDCSNLLAHFVAKDGRVIYEESPGLFEKFQTERLLSDERLKAMREQNKVSLEQSLQRIENESIQS